MSLRPLLVCLPGAEHLIQRLADGLNGEIARMQFRAFPDGESYVRFETTPMNRTVVLVANLKDPDAHLLRLFFTSAAARAQGARRIGLIAPYLPYLRQDRAFHPGEAVSARHICTLLSALADWLVTLDPHLHRIDRLTRILDIPSRTARSASLLADWIRARFERPVIIGPDAESRRWVVEIANQLTAPALILTKQRLNDEAVRLQTDRLRDLGTRTPIIVDDILSTGGTLCAVITALKAAGARPPVCAIIHALGDEAAETRLLKAGARQLVTTNSTRSAPGCVDITPPLIAKANTLLTPAFPPDK